MACNLSSLIHQVSGLRMEVSRSTLSIMAFTSNDPGGKGKPRYIDGHLADHGEDRV